MNNEVRRQVELIFSEVMNIALIQGGNPRRSELANWDSLKHMELILFIEEKFQVRFSSREVAGIHSLNDLIKLIEVKS